MLEVFKYEDVVCARGSREMPWNPPHRMNVYYYLVNQLLIDCGPSSLAREAVEFFDAHAINQVFLTHIHEDHTGMACWLQKNKRTPIYLHPGSVDEALREPDLAAYRLNIWGRRRAFTAVPAPYTLQAGDCVFAPLDAPGHCRYHQVLYEQARKWLFAGDLLSTLRPRSIFCEENLSDMILSFRKILKLHFSTVFCPHTGIHENGRELFEHKLNYLLELRATVHHLRLRGLGNREIDRMLFPEPDPNAAVTGGDISSCYIVDTL